MSDTNRRAKLRGRGAVAQWRIKGAVWAGRLFAVLVAVGALSGLTSPNPDAVVGGAIILALAAVVLAASWYVSHGSRFAAVSLLVLYLFAKLSSWRFGGESLWAGAIWSILMIGALCNGIWGTFELARVARESEALAARSSDGLPSVESVAQLP